MREIIMAAFLAAGCSPATARDLGQWASQDPATREWFRNLHSPTGFPCCDFADGTQVADPDYMENPDGSFEVNYDGMWHHVDRDHIVTATNRIGYAIVWRNKSLPENPPYCFLPGARG